MPSPNVFRSLPPPPRPAAPVRPAALPLRCGTSTPAAREERPAPPPPLDRLRGSSVAMHMLDGAVLTGVLVELGKYELLLRPEVGKFVVVFKASIAWAEEVTK